MAKVKEDNNDIAVFKEYVKAISGKNYYIRPWNLIQLEELGPKIDELWETVKVECPDLNLKNVINYVPKLLKIAPKTANEIIWKTLNTKANDKNVTREILEDLTLVDLIEIVVVVLQQNFLNSELLAQVTEIMGKAAETLQTQAN